MGPGAAEARVDEFKAAWDAMDPEAVASLFAEGGTYEDPYLEGAATGEEIRAYVEEIGEVFPDFRFDWRRTYVPADDVAILEWTVHGTHEGAFGRVPPTRRAVSVTGVSVVEFSEAGIVAQRDYWDRRRLVEQLGLTFPTVLTQLPTLAWRALSQRR